MPWRYTVTIFIVCVIATVLLWLGIRFASDMPGESFHGPLPTPDAPLETIRSSVTRHVNVLAGEIGERNYLNYEELQTAQRYIENEMQDMGYTIKRHEHTTNNRLFTNLVAELPGHALPDKIILFGAHYDTVPGTPGADDNGSAVAALIEIARLLKDSTPAKTLRFVFFTNEEPPFFMTRDMGSVIYANMCQERGDDIEAMIALEMLGYYDRTPGSQSLPFPLHFFYPTTADYVAFVSRLKDRPLTRNALKIFREKELFPSQGAALPAFIPGVTWSDHWAFNQHGYPAIMVTDTAFYRNDTYHATGDLPETLDYDSLARVTRGLAHVAAGLAK